MKRLFRDRRLVVLAALLAGLAAALLPTPLFAQPAASRRPASDASIEGAFQAAMAAEDKGYLDRAQALLLSLRTKHPGIFAVDESLGLLYARRENYTAALPLLEAAVREQPNSDVAHANLGAACFDLHRNQQAITEFERAAALNPKNPQTWQSLGQLWMEAHRPERAAEAFSAALALNPGDAGLTLNRAQALLDAGHADQAAALVASLPSIDQSAAAQSVLGDIDEKNGAFESAVRHFGRAQELDPSEANAWTLGLEFLRHWTFNAAIHEFGAASAKFPSSARLRLGLGAAYFGDSTFAKAIPVFADLLAADPSNALYAELLGLSCSAVVDEPSQRCTALVDYAASHPSDAKVSTYAAAALLAAPPTDAQTAQARKLLEHALAADPRFPDAQYQMGVLLQNQSDWVASIAPLEKAIALKPDYAQAHYRLALAYWRTGRKEDGQKQMVLQKQYSRQQADDLDHRLRQITTFLVDLHN